MEFKKINEYFVNPGELLISKKPIVLKTVLGSCVSVCLFDKKKKMGSMCHYLLPICPNKNISSTKYGDIAIELMIKKMVHKYHSKIDNLQAYLIGGASVIFDERQIFFVGERNVEVAKKLLDKHKIPIIYSDILGEKGRRVIFNTANGEIKVSIIEYITLENLYKD